MFDEEWYSKKYLKNQSIDPLLHFLIFGAENKCNPNSDFDCSWYLDKYPSVKKENLNPFVHYVMWGRQEGRFPIPYRFELKYKSDYYTILNSGLFDKKWFIKQYSLKSTENPIRYYLKNGVVQGLNPSPDFDTLGYLNLYPDVKKSGVNPFVHYIVIGKNEGRWPKPCNFDKAVDEFLVSLKSNKKTTKGFNKKSTQKLKRNYI